MRNVNPKSYQYIESLLPRENKQMANSRKAADLVGLGAISLSAVEGQLLAFLIAGCNAKKVVEIGTLTGLSAQYILSVLPKDGRLWTFEKSEQHAQLAANAIADKRCQILIGDAEVKINDINNQAPFDAVFIDGNKAAYLKYFEWALTHVSVGGLIIVDNVFLAGGVWGDNTDQKFNEKQIDAVRSMNLKAFANNQLHSVMVPTSEGLLICRKQIS